MTLYAVLSEDVVTFACQRFTNRTAFEISSRKKRGNVAQDDVQSHTTECNSRISNEQGFYIRQPALGFLHLVEKVFAEISYMINRNVRNERKSFGVSFCIGSAHLDVVQAELAVLAILSDFMWT
jgi:hypothetical protein